MQYVKAFVAGFVATLVFHQGLYTALYFAGIAPAPPFNMAATAPLGIPAVLSLAFWGGVWGLPVWAIIRRMRGAIYWTVAAVIGAVGPSAVAMLLVFPMKGLDVNATIIAGALMLNAAWGIGVALIMRVLGEPRSP